MKKCKECGKLFQPTSNKQKYCSENHYRPCPVCGKLVLAKYLSDPARCCSGVCKSKLGKLNKESAHVAKEVLKLTPEVVAYAEADVKAVQEAYKEHVSEIVDPVAETIKKRFVSSSTDGWIEGHEYAVKLTQDGKLHIVRATYDYTTGEVANLVYNFTNKKKITTIFKACK